MTYLMNTAPILGTVSSEVLGGSVGADFIVGLDGNDQISGGAGDDILHGDFIALNLLQGTQGASSFAQYDESDAWNVEQNDDGFGSMTQTIQTALDATYSMRRLIPFDPAAQDVVLRGLPI
jgi:serralysin